MIICPVCKNKEIEGALFCRECGTRLANLQGGIPSRSIGDTSSRAEAASSKDAAPPVEARPDEGIYLTVVNSGEKLLLPDQEEVTLGRVSEGQPIIPDIDLTPFQAYELGVSRLHASLQIKDREVTLIDLGSANGTRVNGQVVNAQATVLLQPGDILTLGRLKVQVHIQP